MSREDKVFEIMISEYQKDIQSVYELSGNRNETVIKDGDLNESINRINDHIMTIRLAEMNIVDTDGIKFIIKDIGDRVAKLEIELTKPEIKDNNTTKRFTENNLRRLEECLTVFKMYLIKK